MADYSNTDYGEAGYRQLKAAGALDPRDHEAYSGHNDGHSLPRAETSTINRAAKSDMPEKTGYGNSGSNRYGGGDLPVGLGPNEQHFYNTRD